MTKLYFSAASPEHQKKEKNEAWALRKSMWWKNQLAKGVCYHCSERFPVEELTMDHLIPIARGGFSDKKNCVPSCKECNTKKGHQTRAEMAMEEVQALPEEAAFIEAQKPLVDVFFISAKETYDLRRKVLRPNSTDLRELDWPQDHLAETFHVGAYLDLPEKGMTQVGVSTYAPEVFSMGYGAEVLPGYELNLMGLQQLDEFSCFRLRGMATDTEFHGQGVGSAMLIFAEEELYSRGVRVLWFNARAAAYGFYEKLGYEFISEEFDIPGVGPHKVMLKVFDCE